MRGDRGGGDREGGARGGGVGDGGEIVMGELERALTRLRPSPIRLILLNTSGPKPTGRGNKSISSRFEGNAESSNSGSKSVSGKS